jgi:DNA-binding transcriptional regulator YiaG
MITGTQIRSDRNALRWTTEQLAKRAGVTARTIKRFEAVDNVPPSRSSTLLEVKGALEAAGIEFIGSPTDMQYRSNLLAAVHETALGLTEAGVLAKRTMKAFDEMCLTADEKLTYLNVTTGLISQRERGEKHARVKFADCDRCKIL